MSELGPPPRHGAASMTRADAIVPDPALVGEIRDYLRLGGADEDALLARLAAAAMAHGEAFTGQLFVARTVTETVPACPAWRRLAATPVRAITDVAELSAAGVAVPLAVGAWAVDIDAGGDGWVRLPGATGATRVAVTVTAGIAAGWAALPEALRQGTVRLATHLFTNRDSAEEGTPPAAVAALWRPWRRIRLS